MDEIKPADPVDQPVNKQVGDELVAESPRGIKPDEIIDDYFDSKYQEERAASNKKDGQEGDPKLTIGGNLGTKKIIKDHAKNILEYQHAGDLADAEADDYDIVESSEYQHGGAETAAEMDGYDVVETSECQQGGSIAAGEADGDVFVDASSSFPSAGSEDCSQSED